MINFNVNKKGVYDPRPYQVEGLTKIAHYLSEAFKQGKSKAGFVEYSVGYGKTGIYAFIARYVTKNNANRKAKGLKPFRVLVIAHQSELTKQNSEFAWSSAVPNTIVASDFNKGKHSKNMELLDVVFANEKTLGNRIEDPTSKMFDNWTPDLICIDECHRLHWKDFVKFQRGDNDDGDKPSVYTKILHYFLSRNNKCQILGGSGSPWRNNEWIKGTFWEECIDRKDTADLIDEGYLSPVKWGVSDKGYDYSKLDYTLDMVGDKEIDLDEAQAITLEQSTTTETICREVVSLSKDRNACLLFCSGQDHLKEVAKALIDAGAKGDDIGIITESTGFIARSDILDRARKGECKYVLNVSVLTTGVNVPLWDMLVFLRPVGSVVLFTQAVGRVLRIHDSAVRELGFEEKKDALVLDYAGVYERLGHLADELSNEETIYKHESRKERFKFCPKCERDDMSFHAVICGCGHDFGDPKQCKGSGRNKGCGHLSKSTARRCEKCHTPLKDVNENLSNKHYRKYEFDEVESMGFLEPIKE